MNKKNYSLTIGVFCLSLSLCLLFIVPTINTRILKEKIQLENMINDKSIKISESISIPVNQLYTVASYIERNKGDLKNIEEFAETIVHNKYVRNLIIAPNFVVSDVFPDTKENQQVIGLEYSTDQAEGNEEAMLAVDRSELLLAGPFTTVVGDQAISGRYPIILTDENEKKDLWGLVAITLEYPEVMEDTNLDLLSEQGYTYELWHMNVDSDKREVIMSNGRINEKDNYVDKSIKVLNAEWYLRITPIPKWYQYYETWIYISISLIISVMVAAIVEKNFELRAIKQKLEKMVHYDQLTNLLNRKGLFFELEQLTKHHQHFQIFFMDLNNFKQINDEYGHGEGDKVLIEFARRINIHIGKDQLFVRMGGDEFLIIQITDSLCEEKIQSFWEQVYQEFDRPIMEVMGKEIYLSFSKGSASYSSVEDSLDDIISKADYEMYLEKKEKKFQR